MAIAIRGDGREDGDDGQMSTVAFRLPAQLVAQADSLRDPARGLARYRAVGVITRSDIIRDALRQGLDMITRECRAMEPAHPAPDD